MLTKGLDNFQGKAGNDTIIGSISGDAELNTFSVLDLINGGAGTDTLKISTAGAKITVGSTVTGVEVVEASSAAALDVDTTASADVLNLNVTGAGTSVAAKASATTDINVAMKQGAATVVAGATGTGDVDTKANIAVTGGKNVTVNLTDVKQVLGDDVVAPNNELNGIVVGGAGAAAATGDVVISTTGAKTAANADAKLSSIAVTGGKTISVTQKATGDASAAATDKTGTTITQGVVNVTGNALTTAVTVKQDASVAEVLAVDAVAAKATTKEVVFSAAKKGDIVAVDFGEGKLSFTANKDLTAAEAASAFANLVANAKQGNAAASLGIYTDISDVTGKSGVTDNWTSGAVQTVSATQSKVVFSSSTAAADLSVAVTPVGAGSTFAATAQNLVAGTATVAAKAGVLGVANGVVTIKDSAATGTIKTITVDGYAANSRIGGIAGEDTTSLETLNLSNSGLSFNPTTGQVTGAANIQVDDTAATLALNLEKVGFSGYYNGGTGSITHAAAVDLLAAPTTLNVTSTGNNYVALTADATENLNVAGTGLLDASSIDLAALKTVKVTGTAGLKLHTAVSNTISSVDTTGTTGTVTVAIKGDFATYAGGAGVDNVTIDNANSKITKSIDLGAGNDTLTLAGGTIALPEIVIKGGEGIDTLVMDAAQAAALTVNASFSEKIEGFEKLSVGQVAAAGDITVNLANMDNISHVISAGAVEGVGGSKEVTTVTFEALQTGQSLTIAGKTVAATQYLTAANVADAMSGATVTGATVTGDFASWAVKTHTAGQATMVFEAAAVGNATDLSTLITSANSAGATLPTTTTTTPGTAGSNESAVVTFGSLVAGDTVTVNGLTLTATAFTEKQNVAFVDVTVADGGGSGAITETIIINGVTVSLTGTDDSSSAKTFTAAEIAAAFANDSTTTLGGGTIAITGSSNGLFAAALNGTNVEYTSVFANTNVAPITVTGTLAVKPTVTTLVEGNNGQLTAAQVAEAFDGDVTSNPQAAVLTGNNDAAKFVPAAITSGTTVTFTAAGAPAPVDDIAVTGASANTTQGVAPATEAATVAFTALKSGQFVSVAGRIVTATGGDLTAAQVEAAYLANTDSGFAVVSGTLSAWSVVESGAAGDGVLAFTSTQLNSNAPDLSTLVSVNGAVLPNTALVTGNVPGAAAGVAAGLLTLDKMANNGTLELTGAATTTTVKMLDATGAADTFNIVANAVAADAKLGTVVVSKVETINVSANDTDVTTTAQGAAKVSTNSLTLNVDSAATVNVTGAGNLVLDLAADSKAVTLIDGSTATGKLTITTLAGDNAATTVKGGSADDVLVAKGANDVLLGGAGKDTLKVVGNAASAVTLTGGEGIDSFDVSGFQAASAGAAAVITDFTQGETIKFASSPNANFVSSKVTLIGEATYDNYVTEAAKVANQGANGSHGVSWFQYEGNTFVVQDVNGNAAFDNNTDIVVKLVGAFDLSASSFNEVGQGTLLFI